MQGSTRTTQVLTLPAGLPAPLVDAILTAAEEALVNQGARRIRLETSQHDTVVVADLPATAPRAAERDYVEELFPAFS
jgi:hypothetical protein